VSATIGRAESRSRSASRVICRRRGVPGLRGPGDKLRDLVASYYGDALSNGTIGQDVTHSDAVNIAGVFSR
jgi:hypothetical protein